MTTQEAAIELIELRFRPQRWINDYAVTVDPEGETNFKVPRSVIDFDFVNDHYARDDLRFQDTAPKWIREWDGPFEVEAVDEIS